MSCNSEAFIRVPGNAVVAWTREVITGATTRLTTLYNNLKSMMTTHVDTLNSLVTMTTIPQIQSIAADLRARLGVMIVVLTEFFTLLGQIGATPFHKIVTFVRGARGMNQEDAEVAVRQQLGTFQQWGREIMEMYPGDDMAEMHGDVTSSVAEQTGFITAELHYLG